MTKGTSFVLRLISDFAAFPPRVCLIIFFTRSDAEDVTSPRREAAASPIRVASPVNAPAPSQPETTPTTPAPSLDKTGVAADFAASSFRPATWEEHVSVLRFNFLCISVDFHTLMLLLYSRLVVL